LVLVGARRERGVAGEVLPEAKSDGCADVGDLDLRENESEVLDRAGGTVEAVADEGRGLVAPLGRGPGSRSAASVQVAVTDHPTAAWTAQQLRNAFPEDQAPRYLLHDRDTAFTDVMSTIVAMQILEVLTAPRSPWQNAYVERVIGSIRRECLDHVIVLSVAGLQRVLADYVGYYMNTRTHLSLGKDAPTSRPATPLSAGRIVEIPQVNGLHHRYDRAAP
jgi:hypothetical protein